MNDEHQPNPFRDELNFAEFPLACVSDRLPAGAKTLVFQDQITDQRTGKPVTRKLTISASDRFGLPTAMDQEVIVGLIQLTSQDGFQSRSVPFSRYRLIRLLDWRDEGRSYERITTSLNRWAGVTLYFENAWWNKERSRWVSETFHIIERVTGHVGRESDESSFTWNEVIFDSFQSGNLKQLDMDFYNALRSQVSKRMYRFLDKHFWKTRRLSYDLQDFALEHIGISRKSPGSEVRRRIKAACEELEEKGFLRPLPYEKRFEKQGRGVWKVHFEYAHNRRQPKPEAPIVRSMIDRGFTASTARRFASDYSHEQIERQLEAFDWLVTQKDKRVSKNPPGYLYRAIEHDYTPPAEFVSRKSSLGRAKEVRLKAPREVNRDAERESAFDSFWEDLSERDRAQFETHALSVATRFLRERYDENKSVGGAVFEAWRKKILMLEWARGDRGNAA